MKKETFDIVIYCPLDEEFKEALHIFDYEDDFTEQIGLVALSAKCNDFRLLIVSGEEMGINAAQSAALKIKDNFDFKVYICLGIAGAISDDLELGDVCCSGNVYDVTQNQKCDDKGTDYSPISHRTNIEFSSKLNFFHKHPLISSAKDRWEAKCKDNWDSLNIKNAIKNFTQPKCLIGTIFTGPVAAGEQVKSQLKKIDRKGLAVETEVGGIFSIFSGYPDIVVMTIRGISDFADKNKSKLDTSSAGSVRKYAVRNASEFLKANLVANSFFTDLLSENITTDECGPASLVDKKADDLSDAINKSHASFLHLLRQTSPEFREADENYWIPAPRLTQEYSPSEEARSPLDVISALESSKHVLVEIPQGYPDLGAPYIYANEIISSMIGSRMAVPILINSEKVAPPRSLNSFAIDFPEEELEKLQKRDDCIIVYIFENLPVESNTKISHIIAELTKIKNCCSLSFLNFNDRQAENINSNTFFSRFRLHNISFCNIAQFIKSHHGIDELKAQSIAFRLESTFQTFGMPAHPTYFAGIPLDFLNKLIDANRKAELIELAVVGFLSFSILEDENKIKLSRTTRKRFLLTVLERMEINGENFSYDQLVDEADLILKSYDFDVKSSMFVKQFFDYGILRENNGNVEFYLPFIRSFLLAELLSSDARKAKKYFDIQSDHFDFSTFIIYCELCDGEALTEEIIEKISEDLDCFHQIIDTKEERFPDIIHALYDAKVGPKLLKTQTAVATVKDKIEDVSSEMLDIENEAQRKQEILDLRIATKQATHTHENEYQKSIRYEGKNKILRDLKLSCTLLGSGAEQLSSEKKRSLVLHIIRITALIIDDWFRMLETIDTEEIKGLVLEDILDQVKTNVDSQFEIDEDKLKDFVDCIVDESELSHYLRVVSSLLFMICEMASDPILSYTIKKVDLDNDVEEVIRWLWLQSIDYKVKNNKGKKFIAQLPNRALPRISVASYIINRAYWLSANEDERLEQLIEAGDIIKPLGLSLPKEE